jgi:3-hydroxyisobutyrate dehydrogenase-like beta-hydroxyacid dehydrogenase
VIARIVTQRGATFVEAAVMAAVPPKGHRVPMLLSGTDARAFADLMTPFGMKLEVLGTEIGQAAAVKMCRSIIIKGMEALFMECLLAGSRHGVVSRVYASLAEGLPGVDWNQMAHYFATRIAIHGERRAHEMEEVSRMLASVGVEPIMASATGRRIGWCANLGLAQRFTTQEPTTYDEVLDAISAAEGTVFFLRDS